MGKKTRSSFELFPTDAPVGAAELIGRERDVARVAAALSGGGNVIIAGPRRTGKTSVALAAVEECARSGLYTCRVDLFRMADAHQLAEALVGGLLVNRPALRRAIHHAREGGRRLVDALSGVAVRRALGELDLDLRVLAGGPDPAAVREALELARRIAEADGVRVVLFFDEFQEVAAPRGPYGDPDVVTKQMRAVLQDSPQVSTLFAGSMQHLMRDLFAPTERAFSQFGAFHELEPISPGDWRDGLAARFVEGGTPAADRPLAQLVAWGEGHPRATMLLAQQTHLVATEESAGAIDEILVAEGLDRAMRADRLKHEQTLEQIRRLGRHALRLGERVARGEALYEGLSPKVARDTLNALRDAGIVDTAGPRQGWSVVDPLVRRFLAGLPG